MFVSNLEVCDVVLSLVLWFSPPLRSSVQGLLVHSARRTSTIREDRVFSMVPSSTGNGLPLELRLLPKGPYLQRSFHK